MGELNGLEESLNDFRNGTTTKYLILEQVKQMMNWAYTKGKEDGERSVTNEPEGGIK
jgi:hypothetical protein